MDRIPYPTDLTDKQWQLIEPLLPSVKPAGRPRSTNMREVVHAANIRDQGGAMLVLEELRATPNRTCLEPAEGMTVRASHGRSWPWVCRVSCSCAFETEGVGGSRANGGAG